MKISEIYSSVQGEGRLTGTPSVFIRTTGCNLRCWFCDTPFTSWKPVGEQISIEEILRRVLDLQCQHVVLTGGEPMLPAEIVPLTRELRRAGLHLTIETAGTIDRPVDCDLMSISPKLGNSTPQQSGAWQIRHETLRFQPDVLRRLMERFPYQLKFVMNAPDDLDDVRRFLKEFPRVAPEHVWMMPQGIDPDELSRKGRWVAELAAEHGFHFCPRKHIELFGHVRGT